MLHANAVASPYASITSHRSILLFVMDVFRVIVVWVSDVLDRLPRKTTNLNRRAGRGSCNQEVE